MVCHSVLVVVGGDAGFVRLRVVQRVSEGFFNRPRDIDAAQEDRATEVRWEALEQEEWEYEQLRDRLDERGA